MPRRQWKRLRPSNISHAMELCLAHADKVLNRNVDRIADRIGLENKWMIYKWVQSGRIPAILIRPFEIACGINYVTQYIAHSDHKLLIDIPTGRNATHKEINELSLAMNETSALLMTFQTGDSDANETIAAITEVMESLAWHQGNVEKSNTPELGLFNTGETA